jgi:hypothetical protein
METIMTRRRTLFFAFLILFAALGAQAEIRRVEITIFGMD